MKLRNRYDKALLEQRPRYPDTAEYLSSWMLRTRLDEKGCWVWQGSVCKAGQYGVVGFRGTSMGVHRASYLIFFRPPAPHMEIHHTCENRRCWRPDHLVPMTIEAHRLLPHTRRRMKHCPNGHLYTEDNVRIDGRGIQRCLICQRAIRRRYYEKSGR